MRNQHRRAGRDRKSQNARRCRGIRRRPGRRADEVAFTREEILRERRRSRRSDGLVPAELKSVLEAIERLTARARKVGWRYMHRRARLNGRLRQNGLPCQWQFVNRLTPPVRR